MDPKAPKGVSRIHFFFIKKVWCDVLIWYYDTNIAGHVEFCICDIHNNLVCTGTGKFYPFRLESKYRYSDILFDKLIHLLDYKYRDMLYGPIGGLGDFLYYYTFSLRTGGVYKIIKETATNYHTGSRPIIPSIFFDYIHFIEC